MRSELLDLALPVADDADRSDDQRRFGQPALFLLEREMRERLDSFAQAHVIGEDAAQVAASQKLQPSQAFLLVRTQRRLEALRRLQRLER